LRCIFVLNFIGVYGREWNSPVSRLHPIVDIHDLYEFIITITRLLYVIQISDVSVLAIAQRLGHAKLQCWWYESSTKIYAHTNDVNEISIRINYCTVGIRRSLSLISHELRESVDQVGVHPLTLLSTPPITPPHIPTLPSIQPCVGSTRACQCYSTTVTVCRCVGKHVAKNCDDDASDLSQWRRRLRSTAQVRHRTDGRARTTWIDEPIRPLRPSGGGQSYWRIKGGAVHLFLWPIRRTANGS